MSAPPIAGIDPPSLTRTGLPSGVLVAAGAGTVARLLLAGLIPITTDEAYYALWAGHLAPGYLDHPPAVAYLMAASLRTFGHHVFAARLPAVLLLAGTTLLAAALVRARAGDRAAVLAAVLLQAAPVFSLGGALMTPDAPLAFAWTGTLWALERALRSPRWFLLAGAFLGMAALAKLTSGLLAVGILAALLSTAGGRTVLRSPWPWLGGLVAALVASPFLLWNAANGWPSLVFQARHGLHGSSFSAGRALASVGAQLAYVSPVVLGAAALASWRPLSSRDPLVRALALTALPVVLFFTVAAARTPGSLPHWPAPGWLSAVLLLAIAGGPWIAAAVRSGLALSALAVIALVAPLPARLDPLRELRGYEEASRVALAAAQGRRLAAGHWMTLGQLAWYTGLDPAYVGTRPSGPSLWEPSPAGPLLIVIAEPPGPAPARLGLEEVGSFAATHRGEVVRRFTFLARP